MAEQQIMTCLNRMKDIKKIEMDCENENENENEKENEKEKEKEKDEEPVSITLLIDQVAVHCLDWREYGVYRLLMDPNYNFIINNNHDIMFIYQELVYHLILNIGLNEKEIEELTKLLFGEKDEYKINCKDGEDTCIFTDRVYSDAYELAAREHMEAYRAGYFETEDLEGEQLERHLEFCRGRGT